MAEKKRNSTIISNRKAGFEFHLEERYTTGIVLAGTEVKSLRNGKASLEDAYCFIDANGEAWIRGLNISPYEQAAFFNHEAKRPRKLLLRKPEIRKIRRKLEEKGYTLVPVKLYFNERNFAKLEIALGKGKKTYDKREDIKSREIEREQRRSREED